MRYRFIPILSAAALLALPALVPLPARAQTGADAKVASGSEIPRMPDGKPDLSGLWDHPFVVDMSKDLMDFQTHKPTDKCGAEVTGCSAKGTGGELPMTPWAANWTKTYDPTKFDATGHCNPMGYTRSMNAPVPTEIVQTPKELVFLHESMFAFHVVYLDGRMHPDADEAKETMWYGHSVGHWEGDTLVVDTVGPFFATPKMLLDTRGHPVSENLHIIERFRRLDATHLGYEVTIDDPKMYTKPFTNVRTWVLMPKDEEILEYVCTENNKEVEEHHIK
ncbi:MAG TPA: hypothetical protein VMB25_22545 [Bryobacteraceae bacterium]|nr:hypothetical protein [Bryobacteraceae bacterium]